SKDVTSRPTIKRPSPRCQEPTRTSPPTRPRTNQKPQTKEGKKKQKEDPRKEAASGKRSQHVGPPRPFRLDAEEGKKTRRQTAAAPDVLSSDPVFWLHPLRGPVWRQLSLPHSRPTGCFDCDLLHSQAFSTPTQPEYRSGD